MWTVRGLVRRPWGGRGYAVAESGLWRWRSSPVDEAIAKFVRSGRRAGLSEDDMEHLLHFARRSALRALRDGNRQYVMDAFEAISYIDTEEVLDVRDAICAGYLAVGVARELSMPAEDAFDAVARANPQIAECMVGDDDEDGALVLDNLHNLSGDRIVPTAGGPVLVTDVSDDEHPYRPDGDLIGLALRLGQAMQNGGTHVVDVCVGPSILVSIDESPAFAAATAGIGGRVSVEGVSITLRGLGDVDIDLIEVATREDAAVLAAGASADRCLHERRLVGLINGSKARSFGPVVDELLAAPSGGEPDR